MGKPGTVTVVVRATDMAGEPTGAVLAAGTFNGDTITTDTNGEAISVDMTPQIQLDAATQYCFYLSADFT